MSRGTEISVVRRLGRMVESRRGAAASPRFHHVAADTLQWLGRPYTAARVRLAALDQPHMSDRWRHVHFSELARSYISAGRLAPARHALGQARRYTTSAGPLGAAVAVEVEAELLLAEDRHDDALHLLEHGAGSSPRSALLTAKAALCAHDLDRVAELLDAACLPVGDAHLDVAWLETGARRLELTGDVVGAARLQGDALDIARRERVPSRVVDRLVDDVEAWLADDPCPSRRTRVDAIEGGLSDLRSALGSLMLLCDLTNEPGAVAHAAASLVEITVLIEAMSIDTVDIAVIPIDLRSLIERAMRSVAPLAHHRELHLVNAVTDGCLATCPEGVLALALQCVFLLACTTMRPGDELRVEADASPLVVSVVVPRATEEQRGQLAGWFEATVGRGELGGAARARLSVLGLPLLRLRSAGLMVATHDAGETFVVRIQPEKRGG